MSQQRHILIVDDSLDIQSLLAFFLKKKGYRVSCANTGVEALEILNNGHGLPDAILLDLMMPEMDGYEFRRAQVSDPKFAHIPVVIMTADNNVQGKGKEISADAFLHKPFRDPDSILRVINLAISTKN